MSMLGNEVKATLVFENRLVANFERLAEGLKRPLRNIAISFDEIEMDSEHYVLFDSDNLTLKVTLGRLPILKSTLSFAKRVDGTEEDISSLIHDYIYSLEIRVTDGLLDESTEETKLAVCQHVVQSLVHSMDVTLVHWLPTNMLFTAEEFSDPTALRPVGRISRGGYARPADLLKPIKSYSSVNDTRSSGMWSDVFPSLEAPTAPTPVPAAGPGMMQKLTAMVGLSQRKEADVVEQITVYVMTVTLMVLAFPVGFAMLIYNILRGESFSATARVMALNGAVMGLMMLEAVPNLASLV